MSGAMTKGYKALIEEANAEIETLSVADAMALHGDPGVVFVDIRDIRELGREGRMPGAVHAPRGMLEFWVDPDSPYHKPVFGEDKRFVFFCAAGWRSALATKPMASRPEGKSSTEPPKRRRLRRVSTRRKPSPGS